MVAAIKLSMRFYSLLVRITFFFNLFFLFASLLHYTGWDKNLPEVFAVLLVGYFGSLFLLNPLSNLFTLLLLVFRKHPAQVVPAWLLWLNFILLLIQLSFILFLNDQLHY